jgi:predicted PurR-regulated permease PerM
VLAVLRPFATAILFGTILAIAAWPLRNFLLRRGMKRTHSPRAAYRICVGSVSDLTGVLWSAGKDR